MTVQFWICVENSCLLLDLLIVSDDNVVYWSDQMFWMFRLIEKQLSVTIRLI